jgi:hypothetical protein
LKHLRVFLIVIALLLGVASAAILTANAGAPVGRSALTPRLYLPLVARSEPTATPTRTPTATPTATPTSTPTIVPGTWITVLQEGFEATPDLLWQFRDDNGTSFGVYQWGPRDCQPHPGGSFSAWAVGGGADGELLPCTSTYPDNVQTTMLYGPFSLADAKKAQLHFQLRYDQLSAGDDFCWYASDAENLSNATVVGGLCLNAQPSGWTPLDLDLDALPTETQDVSVLGKPQVWVAFRFTSHTTAQASPGPFVDDVFIRECLDTLCSPIAVAAPAPGKVRPFSELLAK